MIAIITSSVKQEERTGLQTRESGLLLPRQPQSQNSLNALSQTLIRGFFHSNQAVGTLKGTSIRSSLAQGVSVGTEHLFTH